MGIVSGDQAVQVKKVLSAAALTYVAAAFTALLNLVYHVIRHKNAQRNG